MNAGAPIIVTALFGDGDFGRFQALRQAHFPPARNVVPAHLTLFHHLPPSLLRELSRRLDEETRRERRPPATIGEPVLLAHGVALTVRSDALSAIRERLANAFHGLMMPQDAASWRPHVTIQNKVTPEAARSLYRELQPEFARCRPLDIVGLASWHYLGGPWEPVRRYTFSG